MSTGFEKIGADRQLQDHWIRRLIAGIVDGVIIWIITQIILIFVPIPAWAFWSVPIFGNTVDLLRGVFFLIYAAFFESARGTTIGKQIMYLKVTTVEGNLPSLDRTLIRDISKIHGLLWLIDTLIGMATIGDPHQKYSDRFARTTVVSTISRSFILPSPQSSTVPPPPSST